MFDCPLQARICGTTDCQAYCGSDYWFWRGMDIYNVVRGPVLCDRF